MFLKIVTNFNIRLLVLIVLIFFIYTNIDVNNFIDSISKINFKYFTYGMIYFLIYPWFGIERWKRMVANSYPIRFSQAAKIYFYGEGLNLMLPSKVGDISKAFFLKKFQVCPLPYANGTVIYEKLLDVISIVIIFSFIRFVGKQNITAYDQHIFIFIAMFCVSAFILFNLHYFKNKLFKFLPARFNVISEPLIDFFDYFQNLKENFFSVIKFLIFSIIFWLGHFFQIYLFVISANIDISYIQILFYMPLVIVISHIPITIAGYGSREVSLLFFLNDFSSSENIVLASLLISLRFLVPGIIGLLLFSTSRDNLVNSLE